jgi:hypothetical protein
MNEYVKEMKADEERDVYFVNNKNILPLILYLTNLISKSDVDVEVMWIGYYTHVHL